MSYERAISHPRPQCPACGGTNVTRDETLSGEATWRCRECGHEWTQERLRPESDVLAEG